MRAPQLTARLAGVALAFALVAPNSLHALTITVGGSTGSGGGSGVELSDYLWIDVAPGADFSLVSSQDVYLYAPGGLYVDSVTLTTQQTFHLGSSIVAENSISLCAPPGSCPVLTSSVFRDVVLAFSGPVGQLEVWAAGSIVVDDVAVPVPEPASGALLLAGLAALRGRRRGVSASR
jgi:hypothetical protein